MVSDGGYSLTRLKGTTPQPFRKYYKRNKETGEVIEHHLPADAYSLQFFLRRGYKLSPAELEQKIQP